MAENAVSAIQYRFGSAVGRHLITTTSQVLLMATVYNLE
jgi:hypothetical protein